MSNTQTQPLFYIMGASGVGKDSIITRCIELAQTRNIAVQSVQRVITRPLIKDDEIHKPCTVEAFKKQIDQNRFLFYWFANGYYYGIPQEAITKAPPHTALLINGSRAYLETALKRYANLFVLEICADPKVVEARLRMRNREPEKEIKARIQRTQALSNQIQNKIHKRIQNSTTVNNAALEMLQYVQSIITDYTKTTSSLL